MTDQAAPSRKDEWLALMALVIVALLPRVIGLGLDPPPDFQFGFLPDEGAWAHNARQHVLFGRWIMDEHNPGLFAAPLYTLALDGLYRLIGIGLVETRLLSAISGFLTCVVWYVALRARLPVRRALPAALALSLSYFMLTNNRVAFTESFQLLLISAAVAAMFHATRRAAWAIVGGCCFTLSLLVKPSAAVIGLVFGVFWLVHRHYTRRKNFQPAFSWRPVLLFIGAGLGLAMLIGLLVILPNWEAVQHQMGISFRNIYTEGAHAEQGRINLFGLSLIGFSMNGFFLQCGVLLLPVVLFAMARLARDVEHPVEIEEMFCWIWLGVGLLFLATQQYQPDRRFLLLLPPLAYLACSAVQLGALRIPGLGRAASRLSWRAVAIGALIGGFAGLYVQYLVRQPLRRGVPGVFASHAEAGAAVWSIAILAGIVMTLFLQRRPLPRGWRVPVWGLVLLFLVFDPIRFAVLAARARTSIPPANRELAELTRGWATEDKVITGTAADVFALGSDLFSFPIRNRKQNNSYMNLDGWERFHPALAVVIAPVGEGPQDLEQQNVLDEAMKRGFVVFARYPTRTNWKGTVTWEATLYGRPDLVPAR